MKAAQYNKYGDTSVIEINDNATNPTPQKGQILVKVVAASINPVESAIRNGYMQQMLPLTFPVNLGGDFSGVIEGLGEEVTEFNVSDKVYGIANYFKGGSGAVAEYVTANSANSALKPESIDDINAASLPLVGASAVQALIEHINLQSGQKILIHGGAGGIGSLAIQIAKSLGAFVATTVGTNDLDFAKGLGADQVIDYKTEDFETMVTDFDAVFDTVGGETTNKSLNVLKSGGILVTMAGQADLELAKTKNIIVIRQMTNGDTKTLEKLSELIDSGKVKPVVAQIFSLEQTKEAYELLENGHPQGKVVIKIQE